jgi:hypothetical protein
VRGSILLGGYNLVLVGTWTLGTGGYWTLGTGGYWVRWMWVQYWHGVCWGWVWYTHQYYGEVIIDIMRECQGSSLMKSHKKSFAKKFGKFRKKIGEFFEFFYLKSCLENNHEF